MQDIEDSIQFEGYFTARQGVEGAMKGNAFVGSCLASMHDLSMDALGLLTICVMVLRNGFTVHGVSACASPENFNEEIGRKIARDNAINQIWPLLGYELKNKLARNEAAQAQPQEGWGGTRTMEVKSEDAYSLTLGSIGQVRILRFDRFPSPGDVLEALAQAAIDEADEEEEAPSTDVCQDLGCSLCYPEKPSPDKGFNFSTALELVKQGHKVRRAWWDLGSYLRLGDTNGRIPMVDIMAQDWELFE
jgi:hypothetical protein